MDYFETRGTPLVYLLMYTYKKCRLEEITVKELKTEIRGRKGKKLSQINLPKIAKFAK